MKKVLSAEIIAFSFIRSTGWPARSSMRQTILHRLTRRQAHARGSTKNSGREHSGLEAVSFRRVSGMAQQDTYLSHSRIRDITEKRSP
jgi:hypothetical protein